MQSFDGFPDAGVAINKFNRESYSEIPAKYAERFDKLMGSPSPVDRIVGLGEFIYANREGMPDSAKLLGASLIQFATNNAFHGLQENDRGNAIVANLRKDVGEISKAPAAPDPAPGYLLVDEAPAPVPVAPNTAPATQE